MDEDEHTSAVRPAALVTMGPRSPRRSFVRISDFGEGLLPLFARTCKSRLPTYTVASWLRSAACWPNRFDPAPAVMRPPAIPAAAIVACARPQGMRARRPRSNVSPRSFMSNRPQIAGIGRTFERRRHFLTAAASVRLTRDRAYPARSTDEVPRTRPRRCLSRDPVRGPRSTGRPARRVRARRVMRPLEESEIQQVFEKLFKFVGKNLKNIVDRADQPHCFRLHKKVRRARVQPPRPPRVARFAQEASEQAAWKKTHTHSAIGSGGRFRSANVILARATLVSPGPRLPRLRHRSPARPEPARLRQQ